MFSRISALSVLALVILAVATPNPENAKRWGSPPATTSKTVAPTPTPTKTVTVTAPASTPTGAGSCDTGAIQCCQSTEAASSPAGSLLLGLLGIVVQGVDVVLGINCSPISVIGVGGAGCSAHPVCCQNNAVGGLISIGCIPITL